MCSLRPTRRSVAFLCFTLALVYSEGSEGARKVRVPPISGESFQVSSSAPVQGGPTAVGCLTTVELSNISTTVQTAHIELLDEDFGSFFFLKNNHVGLSGWTDTGANTWVSYSATQPSGGVRTLSLAANSTAKVNWQPAMRSLLNAANGFSWDAGVAPPLPWTQFVTSGSPSCNEATNNLICGALVTFHTRALITVDEIAGAVTGALTIRCSVYNGSVEMRTTTVYPILGGHAF